MCPWKRRSKAGWWYRAEPWIINISVICGFHFSPSAPFYKKFKPVLKEILKLISSESIIIFFISQVSKKVNRDFI